MTNAKPKAGGLKQGTRVICTKAGYDGKKTRQIGEIFDWPGSGGKPPSWVDPISKKEEAARAEAEAEGAE